MGENNDQRQSWHPSTHSWRKLFPHSSTDPLVAAGFRASTTAGCTGNCPRPSTCLTCHCLGNGRIWDCLTDQCLTDERMRNTAKQCARTSAQNIPGVPFTPWVLGIATEVDASRRIVRYLLYSWLLSATAPHPCGFRRKGTPPWRCSITAADHSEADAFEG